MEEKLIDEFMLKYSNLFDKDEWFWKSELLLLLDKYKTELNKTPFEKMMDGFNNYLLERK